MSTASLSRFTVPVAGANDASAGAQGLLMPKLAWRFRVTFIGLGVSQPTTEMTKQVMDITRPTVQFGDIVVDVYNSKIKLLGKPEWQDVTVNLRDDATGACSKLIGEQLQKQFDFAEQSSASSGIDYKFVTQIEMLDGGNGNNAVNVLETWQMYGCYLSQVNYGEVNYASGTEVVKIALTIKYDNAEQVPEASTGVGISVASQVLRGTVLTTG
jgi:hypothetical protein